MNENICVTMLSIQQGELDIISIVKKYFANVIDEEISKINDYEYMVTFFDETTLEIHISNEQENLNKIAEIANFYEKVSMKNKSLKENIIKQIVLSNSLITFKFLVGEDEKRTNTIINNLFLIAKESAGILKFENMCLYSYEQKLIISPRGASEYTEYHPISRKDPNITLEKIADKFDIQRIKNNIEKIKSAGLPYNEKMVQIPLDKNTALKDIDIIINTSILSFALASLAATLKGEKNHDLYDEIYGNLNKIYNLEKIITHDTKKVFEQLREGTYKEWSKLTWEYEYVAIFLWVLSVIDFPSQEVECDVGMLNSLMYYIEDSKTLAQKIKMRSKTEILQQTDLLVRYKWACEEIRINKLDIKTSINEMVLSKQLEALRFVLSGKRTVLDELIRKKKCGECTESEFVKEFIENFEKFNLYRAVTFVESQEIQDNTTIKSITIQSKKYNNRKILPLFSSSHLMAEFMKNEAHMCAPISIEELINFKMDFAIDINDENTCLINYELLKKEYERFRQML